MSKLDQILEGANVEDVVGSEAMSDFTERDLLLSEEARDLGFDSGEKLVDEIIKKAKKVAKGSVKTENAKEAKLVEKSYMSGFRMALSK